MIAEFTTTIKLNPIGAFSDHEKNMARSSAPYFCVKPPNRGHDGKKLHEPVAPTKHRTPDAPTRPIKIRNRFISVTISEITE